MTEALRVLVIDDDELLLKHLVRSLSHHCTVVGVSSAWEALRMIEGGERFDMLLVDLLLRDSLQGSDLCFELLARVPEQADRIVIHSGACDESSQRFLRSWPRVLSKPAHRSEMHGALTALVTAYGRVS